MDPLSHGLLGATAVQAVMQKRYAAYSLWIVGLLAALTPDLDVFIRSPHDPTLFMIYHRHFTHSLFFVPIAALFWTLVVLLFRKRYRKIIIPTFITIFIAYATHGFLDSCTSYGTLWFWPFSEMRVAWDCISIIDPIFTLFLLFGLLFSVLVPSASFARMGLLAAGIYLGVGLVQHHRAWTLITNTARQNAIEIDRVRVLPNLGSLTDWRALILDTNHQIHTMNGLVPWIGAEEVLIGPRFTKLRESDLSPNIRNQSNVLRNFRVLQWFCDGYVVAFQKDPLVVVDARYLLRTEPPIVALWGLEFPQDPLAGKVFWRQEIPYLDKSQHE